MHLFKKLTFLTGRQHWYCMNYFVDEEALQIEEQNVFTATELLTLMPVWGNGTMDKFFRANDWVTLYYPNYSTRKSNQQKASANFLKRTVEWLFNNRFGNWLDNYFLRVTTKRWKQKEEKARLNVKGNRMGLRSGKHYSKPNPVFFQRKVLTLYQGKLDEMDEKWAKLRQL